MPPSPGSDGYRPDMSDVGGSASSAARRIALLRWLLPLLALTILTVSAGREFESLDLHAVQLAFHRLDLYATLSLLAAGVVISSLSIPYDILINRWLALPVKPAYIARFSWLAAAMNNVVGFMGMTSSTIRYLALTRAGAAPKPAVASILHAALSATTGLSVLTTLVLLYHRDMLQLSGLSATLGLLVLTAVSLYWPSYLVAAGRGYLHHRYLSDTPSLTAQQRLTLLTVSVIDWLAVGLLLWACLHAAHVDVSPTTAIAAFALSQALGMLSLIPGGLGVFEGTMLLLLGTGGTATAELLTGLLLFRVVYYFTPFLFAAQLLPGIQLVPDGSAVDEIVRRFQSHPILRFGRVPLRFVAQIGTRVLAYATFTAGAVLLMTAAFPTVVDRLAILEPYLPWQMREGFHLSSVIAGTLLLGMSRGISAGMRGAYRGTQIILLAGALLVLLRGLDIEEALLLVAISILLRANQARFMRRGYPLSSVRTLRWLAAMVVVLFVTGFLGTILYATQSPPLGTNELLTHAVGFERALLIMSITFLAWLAWTWYAMPAPAVKRPTAKSLQQASRFYSDVACTTYSYLSLLGDKYLRLADDGRSLCQYGIKRNHLITLGDPACAPADLPHAIQDLRRFADDYGLIPALYQIEEAHLHHYHEAGFRLLKLGETARVELASFTLEGKRGSKYRAILNRAGRDGLTFEILPQPLDEVAWRQLRDVSDAWLADRGMAEIGFSLGYFDRAYLARFPIAIVKREGNIIAFANVVEDFGHGQESGIDLMRHLTDAPHGTMDFLFVQLLQHAKDAHFCWFDLGMAPLSGVGRSHWSPLNERLLKLVYEFGNRFYNYKGLRQYKEKFHPEWRSMYLAYPHGHPLASVLFDVTALITGGYWRALRR